MAKADWVMAKDNTARRGGLDRLAGWPPAVRAVTAEQLRAAAERYIQPDQMRTVIIGQLDAVRKARHPRWPVTLEVMRAHSGACRLKRPPGGVENPVESYRLTLLLDSAGERC